MTASDENWRLFNCFFQSGRAKDLSSPLYTAPSSSACAQCTPRDVNGLIWFTRVRVRHTRSDVFALCLLVVQWIQVSKLKCVLSSLSLKYCLCAQPFEPVVPVVCALLFVLVERPYLRRHKSKLENELSELN